MLLSKLGSDASSESSIRDSKSPATLRSRLPVPKENLSHPGKIMDSMFAIGVVFLHVDKLKYSLLMSKLKPEREATGKRETLLV